MAHFVTETQVRRWLSGLGLVSREPDIAQRISGRVFLHSELADGIVLCRLACILKPGCIDWIHHFDCCSFWAADNVNRFLLACRIDLKLDKKSLFKLCDIVLSARFERVIIMIIDLGTSLLIIF